MNDSDSVICIFSSSDDEKALEEVENFEDDEDQPDILIDTSKDYIKPTYNFAKYYNPDKKPAKNDRVTGHSLLANMVPSLVVIDIDQPKNRQVDLWAMFKDKLSDKDVVVKTGSGGLHIYCKKGTFKPKNNRMTHWYDSPDFSIDIFSTLDPNSQSNIILPGSHVRKVIDKKKVELVYKFLRGGTDEPITFNPITRTVNEVLQAIGIEGPNNKAYKETPEKVENKKIDKKPTKVRDHNPTDIFDPALIEAVIAGFDGLTIHNDGALR